MERQKSAMLVLLCAFVLEICMTTAAGQSVNLENSSTLTFSFIPEKEQVTGVLLFTDESPKLRCNHELEEQVDIRHIMPTSTGLQESQESKIVTNSTVNELFRGQFQTKNGHYYLDLILFDPGTNVNGSHFQCIGRRHLSPTSLRTVVETPPYLSDINCISDKEFEFSVVTSVRVEVTIEASCSCHPVHQILEQNGTHSIMHVQCKSEMNDLCHIPIKASVVLSNQSSVETRYRVLGQVCVNGDLKNSATKTMSNDQPKDGSTADIQDDPADNKPTNGKPKFFTVLMTTIIILVLMVILLLFVGPRLYSMLRRKLQTPKVSGVKIQPV